MVLVLRHFGCGASNGTLHVRGSVTRAPLYKAGPKRSCKQVMALGQKSVMLARNATIVLQTFSLEAKKVKDIAKLT